MLKHKYAKLVSETVFDITNEIVRRDNLVKFLYYPDRDPLQKPDLSREEKQGLLGQYLIPAPTTQTNPNHPEIRIYFYQGAKGTLFTYTSWLIVDIFVPDTWMYSDYGIRNWILADEFLSCLGFIGFKNIGKPDFKHFEQINFARGGSCLRLKSKITIVK